MIVNNLVELGTIAEFICGKNLTYILEHANDFSATNYKILQNYDKNGFVKCMKMQFNGKTQLYYMSGKYKNLSTVISQTDAVNFINVIANLFQSIEEVKKNGFLTCTNIDISPEHIFVDPNTLKVYLIYVPIFTGFFDDDEEFESVFRTNLAKLMVSNPALNTNGTVALFTNLQNAMLPFERLLEGVVKEMPKAEPSKDPVINIKQVKKSTLKLVSLNMPKSFSIIVDKDEFVIGRSKKSADGIISENKMVGREHCKVTWNGRTYTVTDLNSSNGTCVNKIRLQPMKEVEITNGDVLRLANLDFKVVIEGR